MEKKTIVFDLDDTLMKEIDYLKSAFRTIAADIDADNKDLFDTMLQWYYDKSDVFGNLENSYNIPLKEKLKHIYRNHLPTLRDFTENLAVLHALKCKGHFLGLITDGYSVTQRNKLKALGIEDFFDKIVISEEFGSTKPNENNYMVFHNFNTKDYIYISDNVSKDFIAPNKLGWQTICLLDNGENIHPQDFDKESIYLPSKKIQSLTEVLQLINEQ